jgi:toxin YhaV
MRGRPSSRKPAAADREPDPPLVVNGWTILAWTQFGERWTALRREVARLRERDSAGYLGHPTTKFLRSLSEIVLEHVPADPGAARFRQGSKLGAKYSGWHRAKFNQRFRLFFRYSTAQKIIAYGWLNDERTLRKEGARTDAYAVFGRMLERGQPPNDWDELVAACTAMSPADARPESG